VVGRREDLLFVTTAGFELGHTRPKLLNLHSLHNESSLCSSLRNARLSKTSAATHSDTREMQQQLGKYVLDELIAVGGMAEIFRAHTAGLGGVEKTLAIKRLHEQYCSDSDFVDMLVNEARIAARLSHKNVAQVFDLEREGNAYFISMEFINGRDLFRVVRRFIDYNSAMPLECALYITQEICSGLSYAHRATDPDGNALNIIHRDISPQNVLISFEGEVKIVDFGIAKAAKRASFTQSGVIKGKFYYMSPEQARGDRVDQRTDIFSAGAILYELVTGRMLYEGEDDAQLIQRVRRAEFKPPSVYSPDIPPQLEKIILKALARDIRQRFQTARELQLALTQFTHSIHSPFDSVLLSELMHRLFETGADSNSAVMGVAPEIPGEQSLVERAKDGARYGTDAGWPNAGADVLEDSPTEVFAGNRIQNIVAEIEAVVGTDRQLRRAAMPSAAQMVDVEIDDSVYRVNTVITGKVDAEGNGVGIAGREPPPTLLYLLAIGGVLLLAWAFIFATSPQVKASSEESGPRLQQTGSAPEGVGCEVRSDPSRAAIWLDGADTQQMTPIRLEGLSEGEHTLTLKLPHHFDKTEVVTVSDGEIVELEMEAKRGILKIQSSPPGASIFVNGEAVGVAPLNLDGQLMREPHQVAANLEGYKDLIKTVQWTDENPVKDVELILRPAEIRFGNAMDGFLEGARGNVAGAVFIAKPKVAVVETPPVEEAVGNDDSAGEEPNDIADDDKTGVKKKTTAAKKKSTSGASSSSASSSSDGLLYVASKPPGEIFVDGKSTGKNTPVAGMPIEPGYHTVKVYFPKTNNYSSEKRKLVKPGAEIRLMFQ